MPDGITILNTVTEIPESSGSQIFLCVIFIILLTVCAGMCVWGVINVFSDGNYLDAEDLIGVVILFLVFAGCCVGDFFLVRVALGEMDRRETIVYATIDDSVPWSEVNDRYELIRQDGKRYQLRVKDDERTD